MEDLEIRSLEAEYTRQGGFRVKECKIRVHKTWRIKNQGV